jgi:hypothetical protein
LNSPETVNLCPFLVSGVLAGYFFTKVRALEFLVIQCLSRNLFCLITRLSRTRHWLSYVLRKHVYGCHNPEIPPNSPLNHKPPG